MRRLGKSQDLEYLLQWALHTATTLTKIILLDYLPFVETPFPLQYSETQFALEPQKKSNIRHTQWNSVGRESNLKFPLHRSYIVLPNMQTGCYLISHLSWSRSLQYVLRDILEFDKTLQDAVKRLSQAKRTCNLILGVGDGKVCMYLRNLT